MSSSAEITAARFRFGIRFASPGVVSANWGPTLRGGLGTALRAVCCVSGRRPCSDCPLARSCACGYVFETPLVVSDTIMRRYTHAPHPFVLEPPLQHRCRVEAGTEADFGIVLIGNAARYVPQLLLAVQELGRRGLGKGAVPFEVQRVSSAEGPCFYRASEGVLGEPPPPQSLSLLPGPSRVGNFSIRFHTPARIQSGGAVTRRPTLFDIISSLCRRLYLLQHFHQPGSAPLERDAFLDAARDAATISEDLRWVDARRHSTRQNRMVPIGGIVGNIAFRADIGILRPLLLAAEYIHIGKDTSLGMGKLQLIEEEQL